MKKLLLIITATFCIVNIFAAENTVPVKGNKKGDGEKIYAQRNSEERSRRQQKISEDDIPPPPPHQMTSEEAQMLKTLLLMSPDELAHLRQMISHLEKTPIEKRKRMAEGLERAIKATPEERQKMMEEAREHFRRSQENLLTRYYSTLPQKEADAEREKFLKMNRDEKRKYINSVREKLGLPPPPERNEKRAREENKK